jgi:hypothetical protein
MKLINKIGLFFFLLITSTACTQNTTVVNYTPNSATISNPERGFYRHTETNTTTYTPLVESELVSYRTKNNNTLLLRIFYLEKFLNSPIDKNYLNAIITDLTTIRNAGLKCIVRFAYSKNPNGVSDATKVQMLQHIAQLKPIFEANADVITLVQAGFIGTWGEWFYTRNFGMKPNDTDYANRKDIMDALLAAIPKNRMVQFRTPFFKQKLYKTTSPITKEQAYSGTSLARIGHFNDCFLSDATDSGTFSNVTTEYPYLESETKYVPMGGETCDLNNVRSNCDTALTEMNRFHWSFMNVDYNAAVIAKFKNDKCFNEISNRLGYRFELKEGKFPNKLAVSDKLHFEITISNKGFATPFNKKLVYFILRNTDDRTEYPILLDADPRFWDKNKNITLSYDLDIPPTITSGTYELFIHIADDDNRLKNRPEYAIQMANTGTWEARSGYNKLLHSIEIIAAFSTKSVVKNTKPTIFIDPIPADQSLTIETPEIASFDITFYNSVGQKISIEKTIESKNKITINTKNIEDGVYLIEFKKGNHKEFKKTTIKH